MLCFDSHGKAKIRGPGKCLFTTFKGPRSITATEKQPFTWVPRAKRIAGSASLSSRGSRILFHHVLAGNDVIEWIMGGKHSKRMAKLIYSSICDVSVSEHKVNTIHDPRMTIKFGMKRNMGERAKKMDLFRTGRGILAG